MSTRCKEIRGSREVRDSSLFEDPEINNSKIFTKPHSSVCLLLATDLQNKEGYLGQLVLLYIVNIYCLLLL